METKDRGAAGVGPAGERSASMPGARLVTTKVAAGRTGGAYSLFEVEVGPGGGEGPHIQHREDECLYVLEGRFVLAVEDERSEAVPGSVIYIPKGTLHAYENVGGKTGRLLAVHTPGGPQEGLLEAAASGPGRGGFVILAAEHGVEICELPTN